MPRISGKSIAAAVFCFFIACPGAHAEEALPYTVLETVHLPGSVKWDYLTFDAARRRLFVARGDGVDVLNTATNKVIGTLAGLIDAHGIALAPGPGYGYVTDGGANNIMIFDYATLEPMATLPAGRKPDGIVYDPASKRVFAANGESHDMTVIDATTNQLVPASLALGGKPEGIAVDGAGLLYVALQDAAQIVIIDTMKLTMTGRYDISSVCIGATGLALDKDGRRLFATCRNKVMANIDADSGKIIDVMPIGDRTDAAAFDSGIGLAFSANGDGTLTVAGPGAQGHYAVLQVLRTLPTARTLALDPISHLVYLSAAELAPLPAPTYQNPHPQPAMKPDSFMVMIVAPHGWGGR